MDRNLTVGLVTALLLAAMVAWLAQSVPVRQWVAGAPAMTERAPSAWAVPRQWHAPDDLVWKPRAHDAPPVAPQATAPVESPPPPARPAAAKPSLAVAPAGGGVAVPVVAAPVAPVAAPAPVGAGGQGDPAASATSGEGAGDAGGTDANTVLAVANVDTPPQPVDAPQPPFPPVAERLGLSAQVHVSCVIEPDGRVTNLHIRCDPAGATCHPSFLATTRTTVQHWRFSPARLRGQPVRVNVSQVIRFDLDDL